MFAINSFILELRKLSKDQENPLESLQKSTFSSSIDRDRDNLSYRIPKYPFIRTTRHDGENVYVRFHSEEFEEFECKRISKVDSFVGLMGDSFKEVWNKANEYVSKGGKYCPL